MKIFRSYQAPNRPVSAAKVDKSTKGNQATVAIDVEPTVGDEGAGAMGAPVEGEGAKKTKHSRKRKRPRSKLMTGKAAVASDAMDTSTTSIAVVEEVAPKE